MATYTCICKTSLFIKVISQLLSTESVVPSYLYLWIADKMLFPMVYKILAFEIYLNIVMFSKFILSTSVRIFQLKSPNSQDL